MKGLQAVDDFVGRKKFLGLVMSILRVVVIISFIGLGLVYFWRIAPARSRLLSVGDTPHFPAVSGSNLNRQEFEFPRDFRGELNLVIVPFQRHQQTFVNTWIPAAQEIETAYPGFIYYELPTIYEMPVISRTLINEGMRAGIPDQISRERTITLYLDKSGFKSALDITNEDEIHLFLVDREGKILWQTTGEFTQKKVNDLVELIQNQSRVIFGGNDDY
jgi:hypothetical protein